MKVLEICDLHKSYGVVKVLKGVSLKVDQGEMYALMGPNGSGKTTLTSIIACTNTPTSGKVKIQGFDAIKETEKAKKLIGYVPQEKFSSPLMTGEENLLYFIRLSGIRKKEAKTLAKELLKKMGLSKDAQKRVSKYSGGMRKKLEIATALLPEIKLLILDEPTTGLDPSIRKNFLAKIKDIQKEGVTVFYVTHIGEDAEIASKVGFIDDGFMIIEDKPETLKRKNGLDLCIINIETSTKNEEVHKTLTSLSNNGKLLETRNGYRFYCEEPENIIDKTINSLKAIKCKVLNIDIATPSLEDVFFRLTDKNMGK